MCTITGLQIVFVSPMVLIKCCWFRSCYKSQHRPRKNRSECDDDSSSSVCRYSVHVITIVVVIVVVAVVVQHASDRRPGSMPKLQIVFECVRKSE